MFYTYTLSLKNTAACIVTVISGALNVISMFVLLTYTELDLYAVVGTTTVLGFVTFLIFTPLYSAWCIGLPLMSFYGAITRIVVSDLIIVSVVRIVFGGIIVKSWAGFIINVCMIGLFGTVTYMVCVFDRSECSKFIALAKKLLHK